MNKIVMIITVFILLMSGCDHKETPVIKEPWIDKPLVEWPTFALTNEISFKDTTYTDLANAFLIDTGQDTLGISCKHIFMVFENHLGFKTVNLGNTFKYWNFYPKNNPEKRIGVASLINANVNEKIGRFNTLKVRDWILFEINKPIRDLYPLKIRYTPVRTDEIVYAIGWGIKQDNNSHPALVKLKCFKNLGDYFYTLSLTEGVQPQGRSGSAVIDKNGYLVGIVSGAEGNLGVMGSVNYLKKMFDTYKIDYDEPYLKGK